MNNQQNYSLQLPYMTVDRNTILSSKQSFILEKIYKPHEIEALEKIADTSFQSVFNDIKGKEISRGYVAELYSNDNYKALIVTLLWGHVFVSNLIKVLKDSDISRKIEIVKEYVKKGQIKEAFMFLHDGETKIQGINVAFFTKILYFLSYNNTSHIPLIYDKWTQSIHASILESIGKHEFHYHKNKRGGYKGLTMIDSAKLYELYCDYNERMASFANQLGIDRADKLEMYLFGKSMTDTKSWNTDNPRFLLYNHMIALCEKEKSDSRNHRRGERKNSSVPKTDASLPSSPMTGAVITLWKNKNGFYVKEFKKNPIDSNTVARVTLCLGNQRHTLTDHFKNILSGGLFPRRFNELLTEYDPNVEATFRIFDGEMILDL